MAVLGSSFSTMPKEIFKEILSWLDPNSLGTVSRVNKDWRSLSSDAKIWQDLYKRVYKSEIPSENAKQLFLNRWAAKIIHSENELQNIITSFFCNCKWDQKRELICDFPGSSFTPVKIQQSYGPKRGTIEGFNGKSNEIELYRYKGHVSKKTYDMPTKAKICSLKTYDFPVTVLVDTPFAMDVQIGVSFFEVKLQNVDVGYGNTLAVYSDINGWKEPFHFFCVQADYGLPNWVGRIPFGKFKFVKIDPEGKTTWECNSDRTWSPRSSGRPQSWDQYIYCFNIHFPD